MPKTNRNRRPSPTKHPSHASQNFTSPEKQQEVRDRVFQSVQEMFEGRIEPEVVYMVLTEFDWQEEKAIDSLFSLCGENVDTEAKKNKLAEIAAQVFGILQSPEQNKFDRRDFPPLNNPLSQPCVSSNSTTIITESRSYGYDTKGNNSEFSPHISASSQSPKMQSSSDSLRSQLENIKSKHMKKSVNKPTSMYGSLLLATGEEDNDINSLQEPDRIGGDTNYCENSLSPLMKNKYGLRQQTISPTSVPSVVGEELEVNKRHQSSGKGSKVMQNRGSRSKSNSPAPGISSESVSRITSNSGLTSVKGHNPLSSSILCGTFQLSSPETRVSLESKRIVDLKNNTSLLTGLSNKKVKTEINDDISEETFPDEKSDIMSETAENQLKRDSLEQGHSHSFSRWHLSKGGNYVAFPSAYGLNVERDIVSKSSTSGTSLDSDDVLDLNLNEILSGIAEENSLEKSTNYSPNVWSPSRSAETYADQKSQLGSRKSSKNDGRKENNLEEDSKVNINTYSTSAFSLEEIRNDAAFSFSVDAPVFVPRLPSKSPVEIPKPINAPSPDSRPKFMTPKLPIKPPQIPQNFMPKVIVQNIPQYGLQPISFPAPVVPHPIGLVPVAKATGPAVSVTVNPLTQHFPLAHTVSSSSQHPQLAYAAAAKKPTQAKVQQRLPNKKNNSNESVFIEPDQYATNIKKEMKEGQKYLIIMRGVPGSGKSTLARQLKDSGEIYSTDDYFMVGGEYLFDRTVLSEAHEWNRTRVKKALSDGINTVIVDNTHTQAWEIKPYVKLADTYKYSVIIVEPETKWKYNARECTRKSTHKVPYDTIKSMLDRFEQNVTVESIRKSLIVKEKDIDVNKLNSVEDLSGKKENKLTTLLANKDDDWTEDSDDFFMKDLNNCEESVDRYNEETFGSSGDEDEDVSIDSSTSASNGAESAKTDQEIKEAVNTNSGKSTPKPLQPLTHMTDILSKRTFLVSPSFSVLGTSVVKTTENIKVNSHLVNSQSPEMMSQTIGHSNLSSEVEEMVDDLIREHVVGQITSDSELNAILEELKVCLQLMPIESDQLSDVEKLIEEKLKSNSAIINEDKTAGDLIETEINQISEVGKISSDGDSTVESLTPDSRVVLDDEQLVASFGDHLEDLNDKEINSITSNIEKNLFEDSKLHSNDISNDKCEVISKDTVISDIDIENVINHIERRLSDLGISPSHIEDAVKVELENASETVNLQETQEQDTVQKSPTSDICVNKAMLIAESKYWNSQQVIDEDGTQENQNSIKQDSECIQSVNPDLSDNKVTEDENSITHNETLCTHSESNNTQTLSGSQTSNVVNNLMPLSDAEAKYWGITTKPNSSTENITKWDDDEQITNPEIPKPRRTKTSGNSGNRKRNNSSKSDMEKVTGAHIAAVTDLVTDEVKNIDVPSQLLTSDEHQVSQQSNPQVVNQLDFHEMSPLGGALTDDEKSPQDDRPSVSGEVTPSNTTFTDSQESSPSDSREISPLDSTDTIISQNNETEKNKTVPGDSATSSPKKKKKSSNRRKLAANFNVPFLDESFKESLKQDWNFLPSNTNGQKNKKESVSCVTEGPVKEVVTQETEVSDEDLKILNIINNNLTCINDLESVEFAYKVIPCRNISDIKQCSDSSETWPISPDKSTNQNSSINETVKLVNDKPAHVLMLDKSTSVEDIPENGIDFMMNCFPSIGEEELSQVLEQCNYNVQWAVDLMLEWKYHLYFSPDVKHKFVDAMMKVHHVPKETVWTDPSSQIMISPDSLFDTCMSFIEKCGISTREHLEKQIIQSGYSRLNSIESKIRQRMNSFGETSEIFIEDEYTESVLKELLNEESLSNLNNQEEGDGIELSGIQSIPESKEIASESQTNQIMSPYNDFDTSDLCRKDNDFDVHENEIFKEDFTQSPGDNVFEPVRETLPVEVPSTDGGTPTSPYPLQAESSSPDMVARSPDGLLLTLDIPKDFAQALLSLFGPIASFSPDEAYAMKLQLEEDYAELVRQEKESSPEKLPTASLPRPSPQRVTDAGVYGKIYKPHAEKAIDSLFSLCGENVDTEAKKNKLAEIAAQVFGILQSPEQNKFDRRDFPPLNNPVSQPCVSSNSTTIVTESRSYGYDTKGNNSEFSPHISASSQSPKMQSSSDSLRSQLENIKSKHMKKSVNKPTSMYGSLLLATGEEDNDINSLQEPDRIGGDTNYRENSLSPLMKNKYGLRQQTISPTSVPSVVGEELEVKTEINDDISEETFPDEKSDIMSETAENQLKRDSLEQGHSHSFSRWHLSKGGNYVAFPSAYGLNVERDIVSKSSTSGTSLDTDDVLDLNLNEILSGIAEENSLEKSTNYSPNVWSPSRSAETYADQKSQLGSRKSSKNDGRKENNLEEDSKVNINTYSTSAFSLEEIRNDAAFSFSVDAPVFVPRLPSKSPVEIPKPINAPSPDSRPKFMTPKLPIKPPQIPQNFMPKVLVQNIPQYGLQPISFPAPVVPHPIGLVPVAKATGPAVSVTVNPLTQHFPSAHTVSSSSQHPQLAYAAAAKKPTQAKVQQRLPNKKNNSNESVFIEPDQYATNIKKEMKEGQKYLIIMRGVPGSGKSTLARQLKDSGEIYSTDDYFMVGGEYLFDRTVLSEAHEWNRTRVKKALSDGINTVIVDNTHTQAWEIKPYVKLADMYKYSVIIIEPETKWKYNARECTRKSTHKVPYDTIKSMLDRFEQNVTVESIRKSLIVKEQDMDVNKLNSVEDLSGKKENKLTTLLANKDDDWTEDSDDFFMKDLNNCEESVDRYNEETFGSSGDEDEDVSIDSSTSASNGAESAKTDQEIKEAVNTNSGKSTPKPLQPLTNMTDNLSKRTFLVSPSFSVLGTSVVNSHLVDSQSPEMMSQTIGHSNLSSEVEEMVDDLIREHVVGQITSDSELNAILEELKVCLQLMPIESDQLSDVEKLIEEKLKSNSAIINEDKTAGDLIETEINQISEVGKNSSDGDSTVESLTPDSRVVLDDEQLVASFGDHLEDLNDKEINSITSNIEKNLFEDSKLHSNDISNDKCEVISKDTVISDIDIGNVIDHIERRLSDLGISPSHIEDAVKVGLENASETVNVQETQEQDAVQKSPTSDICVNKAMLIAESKYWNSQQVIDEDGTQENQNSIKQDSECIQSVNPDLSDNKVTEDENSITYNETLCTHSESNNTQTLSGSQTSNVVNNLMPLSDAEAKYWGITTKPNSSTENITKWDDDEQITNPEIPKPRRTKTSGNSGNRKRNNSSKSDMEKVTGAHIAAVTDLVTDEVKNIDVPSQLLTSDEHQVSQQSNPQVVNQLDFHEMSPLGGALTDDEKSPQDDRPSVSGEVTPSNTTFTDSQESSPSDSREISPLDSTDTIISQNNETEKNKTVPGDSATSSPKKKKKSSNRRKLAANFNVPFLDESFKESLKQDWNFLPSNTNGQKNKKESVSCVTEGPVKEVVTQETEVSDEDLKILNIINNNLTCINDLESVEFAYKVIPCRNISDIKQCSDSSETWPISPDKSTNQNSSINETVKLVNDKPAHVLMLDKSTSVEDIPENGIDFMMNCFPSIGEEELSQVLEQCNYNVQWAVDLMLEWKYHLYFSPDVKHKFVDAMMKVHHVPKETVWTDPSSQIMISPDSLFDTCMSFIEKCGISTREHLEKQIIQSGYSRLNSIESKIRQRMNSFGETSEIFIEDEYTESVLKELLNEESLSNLNNQEEGDGIELSGIQSIPESKEIASESQTNQIMSPYNDFDTSDLCRKDNDFDVHENEIFKEDFTQSPGDNVFEPVRETLPVEVPSTDGGTPTSPYPLQAESSSPDMVARSPDGLLLTLDIPKDFAQALLSLFGPIASFSPGNVGNVELPIDYRTAHAIHSCWKSNYKSSTAYAMKLQLEEDYAELVRQEKESSPEKLPTASLPRPSPQRVTDAGVYGKIYKPHAVSLIDIMNEEKEREVKKQNHLKALHASGTMTAVATKLKQQKLYEAFPGIDEQILDDIYEANSCILEATINAVKGSLANNTDCPKSVLTAEAVEAYEMKLLDVAKQQSLQEMMDSYLYRPKLQISKTVNQTDKEILDPEEFRGEANIHYRLRHECFQKAQEAFSKGMKQVAVFYSEQTFPDKKKEHLIIITGRGNHSRGGIAKLRPAVLAFLNRNKYKYVEMHVGVVKVTLKYRQRT
ncbi:hypothetical protein KUTeg_024861 [Tegillarca granosa]|uniref:Uncharacterized protein n=1 Tax=Tegillarca granosa TaxID=220873 RepID=A0ABQ9E487_TEGGR|nr:hypothetical protein KUTeg_024861 [Tegillarca granosa]